MFCRYCGKQLADGEVCGCSGAQQEAMGNNQYTGQQGSQGSYGQQYAQQAGYNEQTYQQQYPPQGGYTPSANQPPRTTGGTSGAAISGFIISLFSVVFCWVPFLNFVLALLATIISGVGISTASRTGKGGKGLAITGLIIGIIFLIVSIPIMACVGLLTSVL